eukprot:jgi/Astpho2/355/Aster-02232
MAFMGGFKWWWLVIYAVLILPFAPYIRDPTKYFRGGLTDDRRGVWPVLLLTSSVSISWVFAKSILNASSLGGSFGIVGSVGYAAYYTSLPAAGLVIYILRTRCGYRSLPEAINMRYGSLATLAFGLAVLFRLYQEVWSNAVVVASFFGTTHSASWWLGAIFSTLIPVIYALSGGMRASIVTDVAQSVTVVAFLIGLLAVLGSSNPASFGTWNGYGTCSLAAPQPSYQQCAVDAGASVLANGTLTDVTKASSVFTYSPAACNYPTISDQGVCTSVGGQWNTSACALSQQPACSRAGGDWVPRKMWSLEGGLDFFIVGILQGCLSYPFFDPVLTDRAFLTAPSTMLVSFCLAGIVAGLFIFFFGFLGIYGNMVAVLQPDRISAANYALTLTGQPSAVTRMFGTAVFSIVNLIFIVESMSTLDSTFTSVAKLLGPEFMGILEHGKPASPQNATRRHLHAGRILILVIAVVGILPLLADPTALDATTVSGTIVMGLGPPVFALMFVKGYKPLVFHIPFWWGVGMGVTYQLSISSCCAAYINNTGFAMGSGSYSVLLGFNVIGAIVAWGLCGLALLENPSSASLTAVPGNSFIRVLKRATQPIERLLGGHKDKDDALGLPTTAAQRQNFAKRPICQGPIACMQEPKAGRAAVDRSDTIKVHMLSILEESDQIKLSNVPKELQDLVDELQSVPEDQRKKLEPHGIAGEWVSRVQTTDLISKDGKVDLGTLSFKQWKPNDLQLKVDDHVGGVQIGVESDDHYQIDTSFTIEEGLLKGQRAISSALGRYEIDAENPARQTIFFTGLRLQPPPGTEGEALKKWVDIMQPENEGMDDKGVKEVTFPQPAKGFRDFLFYDRSIQVSVGNRGSLTILVPKQS